jgi:hypothetical protein
MLVSRSSGMMTLVGNCFSGGNATTSWGKGRKPAEDGGDRSQASGPLAVARERVEAPPSRIVLSSAD